MLIVNFAYGLIILGATAQQLHDAWKLRVPQTDPTQLQFAQVPQGSQSNQTVETTLRSAASPQPDALALTTVPSVDGKSSATVYLDSRWRAITPPSNARPGVKYLEYEGLHEVAIFDFTQTNQTPEQVSLDTIASLSGFAVGAKPFSAELSGHTVWFADMTGKVRGLSQYLRLYVFRNASGKMWQILMVSAYPVDQRFNERADAFARAVATSD
ncbi:MULTISPECIES: hypothetical protein [unclassified Burkholderia]|uniref:hypothetical protein n=1 Tax=unclassified Burkholderia TaxID=2613784 RepID=UPI00141ECB4D|nr:MULTISPECIES: hypothetical protein [unclassified Burkholderia]NIE57780.1 hypothetical protein [Burkholderia sp. Ap-955]NIG02501.1 hypothetical protein [Burkholderia sp. Tr-849]